VDGIAAVEPDPLSAGALFHARYRVVRALGRGTMGIVYEALDERTNGRRALKIMLPSLAWNDDARQRFQREALVIGGLESEHVVRVMDAGVETLQSLLDRQGRLPWSESLVILTQIARALAHTSAAGIVHRDIKPENVFVTSREDGSVCAKVLDFGLAKLTVGPRAAHTRAMGTPLYMSPEQFHGEGAIGPGADLYALAHLAYAMLAGEPYWKPETESGGGAQFMIKVSEGASERPVARAQRRTGATLPAGFDAWFVKATAVDPRSRFGAALEQIQTLTALAALPGRVLQEGSASTRVAPTPVIGRRRGLALAAIAIALAACATVAIALSFQAGRAAPKKKAAKPSATASAEQVPQPPASAPAPDKECPGGICGPFVVPDPSNVELRVLLHQADYLARSFDAAASFEQLTIPNSLNAGKIDLTRPAALVNLHYASNDGQLIMTVRRGWISGAKNPRHGPRVPGVPLPPACSLPRAWQAAVGAGFADRSDVVAMYSAHPNSRAPVWQFRAGNQHAIVDPACAGSLIGGR